MSKVQVIINSLFGGFNFNLTIFAVTLIAALPLGLVIAFGSMSQWKPFGWLNKFEISGNFLIKRIANARPIRWISRIFVWIIRGTPLMLQIYIVFYVPGLLFNFPMRSRLITACVAFIINYAAYFSEIYRGGIESIPKGQYEAGQVLGMTKTQVFFKVVLFQVIKRIVPPMSNEIITLVKDTSLANVIAVTEIIMCAERFTKQGLIWPLFSTGLYFLLFSGILTLAFGFIERKLNYYKG